MVTMMPKFVHKLDIYLINLNTFIQKFTKLNLKIKQNDLSTYTGYIK